MKSKEEIEQLAKEVHYDSAQQGLDANGCFNHSIHINYFQKLCPKCFGEGIVQNVGTSSSMYRTCPVCNGNKTLIKPII